MMAPYFASAQLAHFAETQVVHTVYGPPGLLLYNVQKVIIQIDFLHTIFEWVDLKTVLKAWGLNQDQFVDACMLAGTEYCLTYPYLNTGQPLPGQASQSTPSKLNFEAAIGIVKQAPLINWMQSFPSEEIKNDHVDGYCICKVLVQSSPVLHSSDREVRPLGGAGVGATSYNSFNGNDPRARQVPRDFRDIMGEKLPTSLYYLMVQGIISHKLPQAFAKGEWVDKSQPLVDTQEFRTLLLELNEYREKAINLLARKLCNNFARKPISCKAFWEQPAGRQTSLSQVQQQSQGKIIDPLANGSTHLRWRINSDAVRGEMDRQGADKVDLKFCLQWHANDFNTDGPLFKDLSVPGPSTFTKDRESLSALVHFMLLEHLELIADDGGMTVIGNALRDSPKHLMEPCLMALELMKFGVLNGEPFEPAQADRPFPSQMGYPKQPVSTEQKSILLLTRVMSLVPMRLKADMWNADVNFDLAAFHSMVRILKRSLRQLTEASLASILMGDLQQFKLLPPGFMCGSPTSKDHLQTHALLPTFMLPRACMGIVANFFLTYNGDTNDFNTILMDKFPCCSQPRFDLQQAMLFWEDVRRCVDEMCASELDCSELAEDMAAADAVLQRKMTSMALWPEPAHLRGDETDWVRNAVRPPALVAQVEPQAMVCN